MKSGRGVLMSNSIIDIKNLSFSYKNPTNQEWKMVFKNISFSIKKGSIVGIAGESGCGKTTLAKAIVNYHKLSGQVKNKDYKIDGDVIFHHNSSSYSIFDKTFYNDFNPPPIQMVFQDPRTSLNMKMKLYEQLKESVLLNKKLSKTEVYKQIKKIADDYKISDQVFKNSIPENLSGGQRRRFGLAKIVSSNPKIIIADEPVSSLDVSIKQDIMNQLFSLKQRGITVVVISHDISLLKNNSDIIYVMDNGEFVEPHWENPSKNNPIASKTIQLDNDSKYVNQFVEDLS